MRGQYLSSPINGGEVDESPNPVWYSILDICENGHLPECAASRAYTIFRNYKIRTSRRLKTLNLIAFSIYLALIELEIPRIPQEIERLCGVPHGTTARIERLGGVGISPPYPDLYTETFCGRLELPYKDTIKIKTMVRECTTLRMVRPQCLNAVMIFIHLSGKSPFIGIDKISSVCSVSENTIKKLCRKIKQSAI